jgi:thiol:disulfide interchange protein DsbD
MRTLLSAAFLALAVQASPPDPVAWTVLEAPSKPVEPGRHFSVKLIARIQDGWHNPRTQARRRRPLPTRFAVAEGQPAQLAGMVEGSTPQTIDHPAFQMRIQLYESEAGFLAPLRLTSAPAGPRKVVLNPSYKACDNRICLPPKTVQVEAPLTVAK